MSGNETLWHRRESWPRDPDGHIFIFRAMDLVGRAMFGEEWTGDEPLVALPHRLPLQRPLSPTNLDMTRVESLLATVPDWKPQPPSILGSATSVSSRMIAPGSVQGIRLRASRLSKDDWQLAIDMSETAFSETITPFRRFEQVQVEVTRLAEKGSLIFASRPKDGGPLCQVSRDGWNTEALWSRYQFGQFKPSDPFSTSLHTGGTHYLFASIESLQACIESRRRKLEVLAPPWPNLPLSPYLHTMLEVIQRLEITPENQPKKTVVELEIERAWQGSLPLSQNLLSTMATLMRNPESQAGRGVKRKGGTLKTREKLG